MKKSAFFLLFLLIAFLPACRYVADFGDFREASQTFNASSFTKIRMGNAFKVDVKQGSIFSVQARGDERNLQDLFVRVENGTLVVDFGQSHKTRHYTTELFITLPTLEGVDFSGAVDARVNGFAGSRLAYIYLSGASVCQANFQAEQCQVNLSGASKLNLGGASPYLNCYLSGASTLEGYGITADNCAVEASGASKAKIYARNTLQVKASGASQVRYIGEARISADLSGASTLTKD